MIDPVVELSICAGLALLFAVAAWHKASDQARFAGVLRAYEVLPSWLALPATRLVPMLEASIAMGLLYAPTRRAAALAAVTLLVAYTMAISLNLVRGRREIDCGCFAASSRVPLSNWLVLRNVVVIASACTLLLPVRARALIWVDGLTIAAALITAAVLWTVAQRLSHTGPLLRRFGGTP
jgi:hypothetical protein